MRLHRIISAAAAAAMALALAACGGGADGGIGGTGTDNGVAYGAITGFGSVWVNGVEYSSSGTVIKLDDLIVSQDDLDIGMVARVEGSVTEATAATITVRSALKGYVEAAPSADRYVVMGQTVQIDALTNFDNNVRPVVGNYVEVHGLPASPGVVSAGYVERKSVLATPPFVVTGFVAGHDAAAQTFTVGGLAVSYAGADVGDMPAAPWNGLLVEAKGNVCAAQPACGSLTATKVEPAGLGVASIDEAEVEGFVTSVGVDRFTLGGQTVAYNTATTVFENGTAADLRVGAKLEAEGSISNGVLNAIKIEFRSGARLEGTIASNGAGGFTLLGLPGITVQVDGLTELDDLSDPALLVPPNHVEVRGRSVEVNGEWIVVATELKLVSLTRDTAVELRGPVAAIAGTRLTVLGIEIDVAGLEGADDVLSQLAVGDDVKLEGELVGQVVTWQKVERED